MEPKKTEKADLANKSFLFLSIGLVISLLLAITAFSYRVYDDTSVKDLGAKDAVARRNFGSTTYGTIASASSKNSAASNH